MRTAPTRSSSGSTTPSAWPVRPVPWHEDDAFDFRVVDSPEELDR